MSTNVSIGDRTIELPKGWRTSSVTLYFEGEDLTKDPQPFAATAVLTARLDVAAKASPADVAASDLKALGNALPGFDLVDNGELKVGNQPVPFLEYEFKDGAARQLRQLVLYLPLGHGLHTVTGTHVAGDRFAARRPDVVKIASRLLENSK